MSYAGLIAETNHPQPGREQLLDEIILFDIEGRATEVRNRSGLHEHFAVASLLKGSIARFPQTLRNHVHGLVQIEPSMEISLPSL
jgi:hypothetical protein